MRTADGAQWMGTSGGRDLETALESTDVAYFGSVTKTLTSALVLQLIDEGRITLEDTIERWVPVPNADRITIRQLLDHTAGVYNYTDDPDYWAVTMAEPHRVRTALELFEFASQHGEVFPPGTAWSYSNTNYVALGVIAEQVAGRALEAQVRERFFVPLGMSDSALAGREPLSGTLAHGYVPIEGGGWTDVTGAFDTSAQATDGALVSSLRDMLTWSLALYGGTLHRESTFESMLEPTASELLTPVAQAVGFESGGYGLGTIVLEDEALGQIWGHAGNIYGYGAFIGYLPSIRASFVLFVTRDRVDGIAAARHVVDALRVR